MFFYDALRFFSNIQGSIWCGRKESCRPHEGCQSVCSRWHLKMVCKNKHNRFVKGSSVKCIYMCKTDFCTHDNFLLETCSISCANILDDRNNWLYKMLIHKKKHKTQFQAYQNHLDLIVTSYLIIKYKLF